MSTVKEPPHPLRTARYLWLGILLCALVGGACFLGGPPGSPGTRRSTPWSCRIS